MSNPMGVQIEYVPFSDLKRQLQGWQERVLGVVGFSELLQAHIHDSIPSIHINAPVLAGNSHAYEVWLADDPLKHGAGSQLVSGRKGAIQYRLNDDLLFGVIQIEEPLAADDNEQRHLSALQLATESAYQQIFALIDELGYPHLYRFWNYMADINASSHALERYRQFNVGRKQVLMRVGRDVGKQLPAACALGVSSGPLSIAFLVGKAAATAVENPRQIRAYDYPEQYGPRTPSFSRAILLEIGQQRYLFISGTASIVGHQTLHPHDVAGQTQETLVNMEAVIEEANRLLGKQGFNLHNACLRVYIRHAKDLDPVRTKMQNYLKREIHAVFIQADICREELLIEIEATIHDVKTTQIT